MAETKEEKFRKIDTPDSPANNLAFDIKMGLTDRKQQMSRWSEWTNKKHDRLYIEFAAERRNPIDWLEMELEALKSHYEFDAYFVNPSTHERMDRFEGMDPKGTLRIDNIKYRKTREK